MGQPHSGILLPVSCLILVWAASSGSIKVLREPTCFSDYISLSTCEWQLDREVNCSAELRLAYWLDFEFFKNHTSVPENSVGTTCMTHMLTENTVLGDSYRLDLWAGQQLLWSDSFQPSNHVKPLAPGNLTVHANISNTWLLTWSNPYPGSNFLYKELTYLVHISTEHDPSEFKVWNVTYMEPFFRLEAGSLRPGVRYRARVRARAQGYGGTWSEWSPSATWLNHYPPPLVQRLPLGVGISCMVIAAVCLSCYASAIKIKKVWWDQIPNPAHSPLLAIIIQDSQVSLWEKRSRGQEPPQSPRWKTCLAKLLPCLLEHGIKRDEGSPKAAGNGPFQSPGKSGWCPVEVSKTVFWPESISVVQCVELFEAPVETKEEEEEEEEGRLSAWPESSGDGFSEGREGIVARLTEDLFLDLLGAEVGGSGQPGPGDACLCPPAGNTREPPPWACVPSPGAEEAASQGERQPCHGELPPPGSPAHTQLPMVIEDNPAYRGCGDVCSCSPSPTEPAGHPEVPESPVDSWEQLLRQRVLQHAVPDAGGYRDSGRAEKPGGNSLRSCGEAGYKAFSSLLASSATCAGTEGAEAGGYKPFQSLDSGCPEDLAPCPAPLFTFGLDAELPCGPEDWQAPCSALGSPSLEPGVGTEDDQQPPELSRDDLGSGIVYSALTCHLCGHLKQHHAQDKSGQGSYTASPCCGCRCGDRASPPGSPAGALGPTPAPQGLPGDRKPSQPFQPALGSARTAGLVLAGAGGAPSP